MRWLLVERPLTGLLKLNMVLILWQLESGHYLVLLDVAPRKEDSKHPYPGQFEKATV